ncbi:MAG TPA: hypothetical protein VK474_05710, partial [Chthoniobacterales bacterium]|nr:hypothetical protein [Chthoniobacterales bacterium]
MKYFSRREIDTAIDYLELVHPFFLITFLAAKQSRLPVGTAQSGRSLDAITDEFLNRYFRLHPKSGRYFKPTSVSDKARVWVRHDYASSGLQAINTQTFRDVFIHPLNSRDWGWVDGYVPRLERRLKRKLRLWSLVVW